MTAAGGAAEHRDAIASRLRELGVPVEPDELAELADAYPALLGWMKIAAQLGHPEAAPDEDPGPTR